MKSASGVVGAIIVAVSLASCSSSPPPITGVVTGRVAACTLFAFLHSTTVSRYAP